MFNNLKANWGELDNLAPTSYITTKQLAGVLGVHTQTLSNWRHRGILLAEEIKNPKRRGNICWYRIGAVKALLEGKDEYQVMKEWLEEHWGVTGITDGQAKCLCVSLKTAP